MPLQSLRAFLIWKLSLFGNGKSCSGTREILYFVPYYHKNIDCVVLPSTGTGLRSFTTPTVESAGQVCLFWGCLSKARILVLVHTGLDLHSVPGLIYYDNRESVMDRVLF